MLLQLMKDVYKIKIGLWIDLTNTNRFYDRNIVDHHGCQYVKLNCRGFGEAPSVEQTKSFIEIVDTFIAEHPFEIIGVAKEQGSVFGQSQDEFVVIPVTTFQKNWGSRQSLGLSIKGLENASFVDLQDQARMLMRTRHKVPYSEKDTFGIVTADAINDLFKTLTGTIATVALLVTSISLVVGGIVIMNIMLVAVTERTREIGIRKSLGARRKDILMQFLIEAVVLSGCGGLMGLGIAYGIKWILVKFTPVPASVPLWAVALALIVSTSTGAIFGIYPAWKAARLDPIVALRRE